jgi:hypothetical protein
MRTEKLARVMEVSGFPAGSADTDCDLMHNTGGTNCGVNEQSQAGPAA